MVDGDDVCPVSVCRAICPKESRLRHQRPVVYDEMTITAID